MRDPREDARRRYERAVELAERVRFWETATSTPGATAARR
jgi:hypothetical protein